MTSKSDSLVFVSYSRADKSFVENLTQDLKRHRINIWIDQQGLPVGTPDWEKAIKMAIRDASAMIYVASVSAADSRFVRAELQMAEIYQCPIYPIWADGELWIDCAPMGLTTVQYADARGSSYTNGLGELLDQLAPQEIPATLSRPPIDPSQRINPYKGLRAFRAEDTEQFFGRSKLIDELVETVTLSETARFLAVVGPSGSGKSSVVMAGLIPRLQAGTLPGSADWIYLKPILPGPRPLEAMAIILADALGLSITMVQDDLERSPRGLSQNLQRIANRHPSGQRDNYVVLLIDQFEEIFTQTDDKNQRDHFIELLWTAATERRGQAIVLITLRADFYDRPMNYPNFGKLLEENNRSVLQMTIDELRESIEKPAALPNVQLKFEDGLVGDLLYEVRDQAGALPLLQFTLDQLAEHSTSGLITRADYERLGGVRGALARHAEQTYVKLPSKEHKEMARILFLRLIEPGMTDQDVTRRRANADELILTDVSRSAVMQDTLDKFIQQRLLTTFRVGKVATVEVSHEALVREWTHLEEWVKTARDDIRRQQMISNDAREWLRHDQHPDHLYRGAKLAEAEAWANRNPPSLMERQFIDAAVAAKYEEARNFARDEIQQEIQKRANLTEIYARITASLERSEVIEIALAEMKKLLPYDVMTIWLRSGPYLILEGRSYRDDIASQNEVQILFNDFTILQRMYDITRTYENQQVVLYEGELRSPGLPPYHEEAISCMAVPLLNQGHVIGSMVLSSSETNLYIDESDQNIALAFASQVAVALANADIFEQTADRTNELGTLLEAAQATSLTRDLDTVFRTIAELMLTTLNVDHCTIMLQDEEELVVQFDVNRYGDNQHIARKGTRYDLQQYPARLKALHEREVIMIRMDDSESLDPNEIEELHLRRSIACMFVPLVVGEQTIGLLQLGQMSEEGAFTQQSIRLARALGSQVAVAIENARLQAEMNEQFSELLVMNDLNSAISSALSFDDLMQILVTQIPPIADTTDLYVALYNPETEDITFPLAVRNSERYTIPARKLDSDEVSSIIKQQRPLTLGGDDYSPDEIRKNLGIANGEGDIKNYMGYPIISEEKLLGVIALRDTQHSRAFHLNQRVLETVSVQIGAAIQKIRLVEQINTFNADLNQTIAARTAELEEERIHSDALYLITSELTQTLDLDGILVRALDMVSRTVNAEDGSIVIIDPATDQLYARTVLQPDALTLKENGRYNHPAAEAIASYLLDEDKRLLVENNLQNAPYWNPSLSEVNDYGSVMAALLEAADDPIGVMVLFSKTAGAFNDAHSRLMQAAARQTGAAYNNADLYHLIREQAERLGGLLRQEAEEAEKNSAILKGIADGVIFTDGQGKIIVFNPAAARILGVPHEEVLEKYIVELFKDYRNQAVLRWAQAVETMLADSMEKALDQIASLEVNGIQMEKRVLSVRLSPVYTAEEFLGIVSVFRDTTQLHRLTDMLQQWKVQSKEPAIIQKIDEIMGLLIYPHPF